MAAAFTAEMIQKIAEGNYTLMNCPAFLKELDELDEVDYMRVFNELYTHVACQVPGAIDPRFKAALEEKLDRMPVGPIPMSGPLYRWRRYVPQGCGLDGWPRRRLSSLF